MAHFLVSPIGSAGDVHPFIAVALALQSRGHRVTMIVNAYFESLVRRVGLDYCEFGTREDFLRLANHPDLWHPVRAFPYIYHQGIAPTMREHLALLRQWATKGDEVIISSALGFGALVAREVLQLPMITMHLQPSVLASEIDPPEFPGAWGPRWLRRMAYRLGKRWVIDRTVLPTLNAWRRELHLTPITSVTQWWHSPGGVLCLFPEWFAAPQPDWPAPRMQTTFPLWDESSVTPLPAALETFLQDGDAPLVFTPGSANQFGRPFFAAAVGACEQLRRRGILLTRFADHLPTKLPRSVIHVDYIPFSQILPRSAALVHHGGIGTTAQALAAGIPQLITPLAHDQFDNAVRVAKLGVGASLAATRLRPDRLAFRLSAMLTSPTMTTTCQLIARRFPNSDHVGASAAAVEKLATVARDSIPHA